MDMEEIVVGPATAPLQNELYLGNIFCDSLLADTAEREEKQAAFQQMYRYVEDMQRLLRVRASIEAELREARRETLFRLAIASEFNDSGGIANMIRLGLFSAVIANRIGMPLEYCDRISMAAPLRNIGKIALAAGTGHKDGQARSQEDHRHAVVGAMMLGGSESAELQMAEQIALTHLEHYDGSGHPASLSGKAIPLCGRIVAAAAAFDRLTSPSAGETVTMEKAMHGLMLGSGQLFDPGLVNATIDCSTQYLAIRQFVETRAVNLDASLLAILPELWKEILRTSGGVAT